MVTDLKLLSIAWVLTAALLLLAFLIVDRRLYHKRGEHRSLLRFRIFSWGFAMGYMLLIAAYALSVAIAPWVKAAVGLPDV